MRTFLVLMSLLIVESSFAASIYKKALSTKKDLYLTNGVFLGGEAGAGFTSLKYMNADVVFDGGVGGGAPANKMYFLNTNYIYFC